MFSILHVTSCDHVIRESCNFILGFASPHVRILQRLVAILIRFAQTKITLFIFFSNWVSKGKRKFSSSRAVLSCNTLYGNKVTIFHS